MMVKFERAKANAHRWTFTIKPIARLLRQEMPKADGGLWIDPMAGFNSPADVTNDLNLDAPTTHHLDALEFLKQQPNEHYGGALFDPPYSWHQAVRLYGRRYHDTSVFSSYLSQCRKELMRVLQPRGVAICFGWNSGGLGKRLTLYRILLVNHGRLRPDTIVSCWRKNQTSLTGAV